MSQQYCEVIISLENQSEALSDQLVAQLSTIGYDGFLEESDSLKAYIGFESFDASELHNLLESLALTYQTAIIDKQNWNQVWESNFSPMQVEQFVGVRAAFHAPIHDVAYELIITPKMSFGTGHHGTTYAVMKLMQGISFKHKSVFDFGTGTGILAILAEKLGANKITAIDNDAWCIENASENAIVNNCQSIQIQLADQIALNEQYDIVIANINRHILEANWPSFPKIVKTNGQLILSGLLLSDEAAMIELSKIYGFKHEQTLAKEGWIAIQFSFI